MSKSMGEFREIFLEESQENMTRLLGALRTLELNSSRSEAVQTLKLAAHSLRGMSATMGYADISNVSRAIELLFLAIEKQGGTPSENAVRCVRDSAGALEKMLDSVRSGKPDKVQADPLVQKLSELKPV
ncbi:MAG: hypothetical protein COB53_09200 [Elusimicrobia bacterium]|nr:MAG: hypothetical protein COB53_09200 [Elusimicrobiota bacterium]